MHPVAFSFSLTNKVVVNILVKAFGTVDLLSLFQMTSSNQKITIENMYFFCHPASSLALVNTNYGPVYEMHPVAIRLTWFN